MDTQDQNPYASPPPPTPPPVIETAGYAPASSPTLAKADLVKRFLAALIDGVIAGVLNLIPAVGWLAGGAYMLVRDGLEFDFMDGRSIGKKLMKLRPVRSDGLPMDITASAKRNWMFSLSLLTGIPILGWVFLIPVALFAFGVFILEVFLVLTDANGRRWGDKLADTQVVEVDS